MNVNMGCATKSKEIKINENKILIEIADTKEKRKLGLSGRDNLCENCGMLFVFDKSDKYKFWMKNMKFDIDILWIKEDVIVDISKNVSHKTPKTTITADIPFDSALEIPAGSVKKLNIKINQKIRM